MNRLLPASLAALALLVAPGRAAALGQRDFIDSLLTIPASVRTTLGRILPEANQIGAAYLSESFLPTLSVTLPAKVAVTFLHEGAGYRNTLGYFTFTSDGDGVQIHDRQLIFPNASYRDPSIGWGGGDLVPGEGVTLRDAAGAIRVFPAGTRIGFFIIADGWNGSSVRGWNPAAPTLPSADPAENGSPSVYSSIDALNPEYAAGRPDLARHAALLRVTDLGDFLGGEDFFVLGFEDLRRTAGADNDFNDCIFLVRSTPETALASTQVLSYNASTPDPDGDGVLGLADYFPEDRERAFVVRTPASSFQSLAFEDNYPNIGDADFNDVVLETTSEEVLDASSRLVGLVLTYHLIARGAGLDHRFGVAVHGVPGGLGGELQIERFTAGGAHTVEPILPLIGLLGPDAAGVTTLWIDDLFPSTRQALPPADGYAFSNTGDTVPETPPASVRVRIVFDQPVDRAMVGLPPYDPFLVVDHGDGLLVDEHLPGQLAFPDRPDVLPPELGPVTFLDASGDPWALLVPYDWRYPLEKRRISTAYPQFDAWATSRGGNSVTWFKSPITTGAAQVIQTFAGAARVRDWTLQP